MGTRKTAWMVLGLATAMGLADPRVWEPEWRPNGVVPTSAVDWASRIALERARAERDPAHQPRIEDGRPVFGSRARFDSAGARVVTRPGALPSHELTLGLVAFGRAGAMSEVPDGARPEIVEAEVRIVRGPDVVEWWRSLPSGLEQGVTIARRPAGEGTLLLDMATGAALRAELVSADEIALRDPSGAIVARYAHVVALDAARHGVPARLAVVGGRIRIEVDDDHARYPLVVDPLLVTEEAMLTAADAAETDSFGGSAVISGDGTRALVGIDTDRTAGGARTGSARVFVRVGGSWTEEATLVASDGADLDGFGGALALTADGSRALVSASSDDTAAGVDAGSARVFVRTGTAWAEEAMLLPSTGAAGDYFGGSVSLSSDGSRAVVGAPNHDVPPDETEVGCAYVFVRTSSTWVEEAILRAADGVTDDHLGQPVVLSASGDRALVGAWSDDTPAGVDAGSARVFVRTGTTWTMEATLLAADGATNDFLGISAAFTAAGDRALLGAHHADTARGMSVGVARVFARAGTSWTEEAVLSAADGAPDDLFGNRVALSEDGNRALISVVYDDTPAGTDAGSARVFVRAGATWTEELTLVAADAEADDAFGSAVALSGDGSLALVGVRGDDTVGGGMNAGSVRVFSLAGDGSIGSACSGGASCTTGFCVDGVCCDGACGAGAIDCQACVRSATGVSSGICAPLLPAVASTTLCRPASDVCDVAEMCAPGSTTCPVDALQPATFTCRAAATACDVAETCTGGSVACPADAAAALDTLCRPSVGPCDPTELCDGFALTCPADVADSCTTRDGGPALFDAGSPPVAPSSGCSASRRDMSRGVPVSILLVVLGCRRRRARV